MNCQFYIMFPSKSTWPLRGEGADHIEEATVGIVHDGKEWHVCGFHGKLLYESPAMWKNLSKTDSTAT